MTSNHILFSTYALCPRTLKIKIADGSLSLVAEKGTIKISEKLILDSILHVPNITCNLLSINKLTKDLNCVAKFFNSHCEF